MTGLIIATLFFIGLAIAIRVLATFNLLWTFVPANTFAFVTGKGNESGSIENGGGGIVDIIHNVPGKRLVKTSPDKMKWKFVDGVERRSILFLFLDVIWIGPFRTLRTNKIHRFRFGKKSDEEVDEDHLMSGDLVTKYVPFSGEQAVSIKKAETKSIFGLDIIFNVIQEKTLPLKSVIRLADSSAFLSSMIKEKVIGITGTESPEYFLKGPEANKKKLVKAAEKVSKAAFEELGTTMTEVTIAALDPDEKNRELFELDERRKREGQADLTKATFAAKAKKKDNDADADRVERVIKPSAENDRTVKVAQAEAYRYNTTVTVVGATPMTQVP